MDQRQCQIYVLTNPAKWSGREILRGVLRFANAHFEWRIQIRESTESGFLAVLDAIRSKSADGIITSEMEDERIASALERSDIPLVVIGTRQHCIPSRTKNVTFITHDEKRLAASAAKYFMALGNFRSYGYVHFREKEYQYLSDLRRTGFAKALSSRNAILHQFHSEGDPESDRERLSCWLASLAKPACILAGYDKRAADVIDACDRANIEIPRQIRVLGIDNDEFTCLATTPKLSSVATNAELEGYTAASKLYPIIRRRNKGTKRASLICKTLCEVVPRESTSVLSPGMDIVRRARQYISMNAQHAITVDDVVNYLHVSRGLAFLRFKEFSKLSILGTINEARIAFVKHKLASSRQSIDSVALSCGFSNPNHLKTLFKKTTGMTMREWRARNARPAPRK